MSSRLDISDRKAISAWLAELGHVIDDLAAVAEDAAAPIGKRRLGRLEHARLIEEAKRSAQSLVAHALRGVAGAGKAEVP